MDGLTLYQELTDLERELDSLVGELVPAGMAYAKAERDYKVAAAKRTLELREQGKPATIIDALVKGDERVSLLRFERDCAEVSYKATSEAINACKLRIRIVDAQASREWGRNV